MRVLEVGDIISFDIYAEKVSSNFESSPQKIIKKLSELTEDDINNASTFKYMYIDKSAELVYFRFIGQKLLKIVTDDAMPSQIKARIVYTQALFFLEDIFQVNNKTVLNDFKMLTKAIMVMFLVNKDILQQFLIVANKKYSTVSHSANVGIYAAATAIKLNLSIREVESLILAGFLHDLGKVEVGDEILYKAEKLTPQEFAEMKKHSSIGEMFAKELGVKDNIVLSAIREHHERLDGRGYPNHLKEEEISYYAKIIAVCDVFDALSTERTYRANFNTFESIMTMGREFVNHLDPEIVRTFISIMSKNE